jgi:hypothetical protein
MNTKFNESSNSQSLLPASAFVESTDSYLVDEYERWQNLFEVQSTLVQRFLETQARIQADALLQPASQIQFRLPDRVIVSVGHSTEIPLPTEVREQMVGGFMDRFIRTGIGVALRQRLDELEASTNPAVAASAGLLRFTAATSLVHEMLPSGRSVRYQALLGKIPRCQSATIRARLGHHRYHGCDCRRRAIFKVRRGELLVPYVPAARHFSCPNGSPSMSRTSSGTLRG